MQHKCVRVLVQCSVLLHVKMGRRRPNSMCFYFNKNRQPMNACMLEKLYLLLFISISFSLRAARVCLLLLLQLSLLFYTIFSGSYNLINQIHCERMNEWALCKLHSCYCCLVSLSLGTCAFWIAKIWVCVCFIVVADYFLLILWALSVFVRACIWMCFESDFQWPRKFYQIHTILLGWIFPFRSVFAQHAYARHILCSLWFRFHIYLICIRLDDMVDFDWMTSSWWILPSQSRRNGHTPNTHNTKKIISHFERGMSLQW